MDFKCLQIYLRKMSSILIILLLNFAWSVVANDSPGCFDMPTCNNYYPFFDCTDVHRQCSDCVNYNATDPNNLDRGWHCSGGHGSYYACFAGCDGLKQLDPNNLRMYYDILHYCKYRVGTSHGADCDKKEYNPYSGPYVKCHYGSSNNGKSPFICRNTGAGTPCIDNDDPGEYYCELHTID